MLNKWLAITFIGWAVSGAAQTSLSVKMYGRASLFGAPELLGYDEASSASVMEFGGLAPAVLFQQENGLYHEFELSRVYYKDEQESSEPTEKGSFCLRYEAGYTSLKNHDSRMRLRYGLSVRGYTFSYSNYTQDFDSYPFDRDGIGWVFSFTPHLEVSLTKHLFFDFSPFLDLANLGIRREYEYNPDFEDEQIDSIDFLFDSFKPRLRAGFGWHFNR